MKTISLGKYRGLAQTSTPDSVFSILALDHRNNLRNALNPTNPDQVSDEDMVNFKTNVVKLVSPASSAVLLDPQLSAAQCISNGSLPGKIGLICAVEATGYTGDPDARKSQILPGWSIDKVKRMGASAVKLLVYYHPNSKTAKMIEDFISQVSKECEKAETPLFLEPLSYSLNKGEKLSPLERRSVVIETAQRLSNLGADVLKAEFPIDVTSEPNEEVWIDACRELNQASKIPWVLLSASVDFDTYLKQVKIACEVGASGVAAGRAVWKEAVGMKGDEQGEFLDITAKERMQKLTQLCAKTAVPWTNYYFTSKIDSKWFLSY